MLVGRENTSSSHHSFLHFRQKCWQAPPRGWLWYLLKHTCMSSARLSCCSHTVPFWLFLYSAACSQFAGPSARSGRRELLQNMAAVTENVQPVVFFSSNERPRLNLSFWFPVMTSHVGNGWGPTAGSPGWLGSWIRSSGCFRPKSRGSVYCAANGDPDQSKAVWPPPLLLRESPAC